MKKVYLIPSIKLVKANQTLNILEGSQPSKGVDDINSKDFSGFEDYSASDDDFWGTSR